MWPLQHGALRASRMSHGQNWKHTWDQKPATPPRVSHRSKWPPCPGGTDAAPKAKTPCSRHRGPGSTPAQGTKPHVPQPRPNTAKQILMKKKNSHRVLLDSRGRDQGLITHWRRRAQSDSAQHMQRCFNFELYPFSGPFVLHFLLLESVLQEILPFI